MQRPPSNGQSRKSCKWQSTMARGLSRLGRLFSIPASNSARTGMPMPTIALARNDLGFFDMHGNVWTRCQEHSSGLAPTNSRANRRGYRGYIVSGPSPRSSPNSARRLVHPRRYRYPIRQPPGGVARRSQHQHRHPPGEDDALSELRRIGDSGARVNIVASVDWPRCLGFDAANLATPLERARELQFLRLLRSSLRSTVTSLAFWPICS